MPVVDLTIDSSGATKGLKQYDTAVDKSGKSTDKLSAALKKTKGNFAIMAAAAASAAVAVGGAFAVMAVKAASDLEETQGKFDVVFRDLGTYAEDAAARISDSYGQSERATKQYLSSIQDLLVPTGLARDEAAQMSVAFTELAADLGSFNNMPTAKVVRDIQSALAGGSETMTKYGIDVKVAAVNAEILALGLDTSTESLERQARTQAILSIALRDSSDAVGDFNRTQGSFANQMKTSKALIEDFAAGVGKELLPHLTSVIKAFNDWAKEGDNLQTMIDGTAKVLLYMAQGAVKTAQGLTLVASAVGVLFGGLLKLLTPLELVLEGLVALGAIDSNPITKMKEAVDGFTDAAIEGFKATSVAAEKLSESIDKIGQESSESAGEVAELTKETLKLAEASDQGAASVEELGQMAKEANEILNQAKADRDAQYTDTMDQTAKEIDAIKNKKEGYEDLGRTVTSNMEQKKGSTDLENQAKTAIEGTTTALDQQIMVVMRATAAQTQLHTATRQQVQVQHELANSFTSSGDAALDAAAKLQALHEMTAMIADSQAARMGSNIGGSGIDYTWNSDTNRRMQQANARQEAAIVSEAVSGGASVSDIYAMPNIYVNQSVSRSDIVNITNEQSRDTARA